MRVATSMGNRHPSLNPPPPAPKPERLESEKDDSPESESESEESEEVVAARYLSRMSWSLSSKVAMKPMGLQSPNASTCTTTNGRSVRSLAPPPPPPLLVPSSPSLSRAPISSLLFSPLSSLSLPRRRRRRRCCRNSRCLLFFFRAPPGSTAKGDAKAGRAGSLASSAFGVEEAKEKRDPENDDEEEDEDEDEDEEDDEEKEEVRSV